MDAAMKRREDMNDRTGRDPMDASGFVSLTDAVPDAILEMRYFSTYNFVGARIDGYEEPVALLTRETAEALRPVSDALVRMGFRLKVFDAYRPQRAVDHFVRWASDPADQRMKPCFYPAVDKARLIELDFIGTRSSHSRGSAVDCTLVDAATGRELDMGGGFDRFDPSSGSGFRDLAPEQLRNRAVLREAFLTRGFRQAVSEWWHFALLDEPWPDTYFDFPVGLRALKRE